MSNSLQPHGLSPWNSLSPFQRIFPTQGLNPGLPHCWQILYQLSHKGSPRILEWVAYPFSSGSSRPRNRMGVSCIAGFLPTELWGTDAKAEVPALGPPDAKNWLFGKDPDVRKDWRQEEKGMTDNEMTGWHHWLNAHESEQASGVGDGQGSLDCCSPSGHKESDMTDWVTEVNWTESLLSFLRDSRECWKAPEKEEISIKSQGSGVCFQKQVENWS